MKEATAEQQIRISNLERQHPASFPDLSTAAAPAKAACTQGQEVVNPNALTKGREECGGKLQEAPAEEWIERATRGQAERETEERAGRETQERVEKEAKERAEREAREAQRQATRVVDERAKETAWEKAKREAEAENVVTQAKLAEARAKSKAAVEAREREHRERMERTQKEGRVKGPVPEAPSAWARDHRGVWIQQKPSDWGSSWASYLFG